MGPIAAGVGGPSSLWLRHAPFIIRLQQTLSPAPTCTELPASQAPARPLPGPASKYAGGGGGEESENSILHSLCASPAVSHSPSKS